MDLMNLKTLSTNDKLAVIQTVAGLQWLEERLLEGKSLRQIAYLLGIDHKTIYRWRNYPDVNEVIAKVKSSKIVTASSMVCESREAAYRVILAYDDRNAHIKGAIHSEFDTFSDLWNGSYIKDYFKSWNITGDEYYAECLESLKNRGTYHLSNYCLVVYARVTAKARIVPISLKI